MLKDALEEYERCSKDVGEMCEVILFLIGCCIFTADEKARQVVELLTESLRP